MDKQSKTNVVCFGGGTGLPSLLMGLKKNPRFAVTAIVNMFDSGGSSGELRDRFGILPPGDILKCLLALAEDDVAARKILLRRIRHERSPGHTGGNALLLGLERVYDDYLDAVSALGQILSVSGRVVPVTLTPGTLCAEYSDGSVAESEVEVDKRLFAGGEIRRLFLKPRTEATREAMAAISKADILCVGPGSFYTSILPNFLPKGIKKSILNSKAPIIFIANLLTEGDGMQGYPMGKVIEVLESYLGRKVNIVIANTKVPDAKILKKYADERKHPLLPDASSGSLDSRIAPEDLWLDPAIARHDSARLADVVWRATGRFLNK